MKNNGVWQGRSRKYTAIIIMIAAMTGVLHASPQQPSASSQNAQGNTGKMAGYRATAELIHDLYQKGDLTSAIKLSGILDWFWDHGEENLSNVSPETWNKIDHAMDEFIKPILSSKKTAPDRAMLEEAYKRYLDTLTLAD